MSVCIFMAASFYAKKSWTSVYLYVMCKVHEWDGLNFCKMGILMKKQKSELENEKFSCEDIYESGDNTFL